MSKTEYEVKILEIDVELTKKRLNEIGASFLGKKDFRRYVYDCPTDKCEKWMRLRTDGQKTTLTIKEVSSYDIGGVDEIEIETSSFEETKQLLDSLGYTPVGYQENIRESYIYENVQFEIDYWPEIPVLLEIEADSEANVQKGIDLLNLKGYEITADGINEVYERYGKKSLLRTNNLSFNN